MSQKQLSTVYVADLPVGKDSKGLPVSLVDEDFLRHLFQDFGVVEDPCGVLVKARIGRNGNPYAYAFIKFKTHEDAVKAISELNYTKIDNVPIRMILADEKNKTIVKSNQGSLLIKNLDPDIGVSQLHDAFANFGEIVSCKIPTDTQIITKPDGTKEKKYVSKGYGYIQFRNPEDAKQAMEDLKDASINGRPIEIQPFYGHPSTTYVKFYIKNLPLEFKDEDLKNLCEEFGKPISYKIFTDENGKSEQLGFCVMENHEFAVKAVECLNERQIGDSKIMCYREISTEERISELDKWIKENNEKVIYVKNFDESVTDDELSMIFSKFGHIESAKVVRDGNDNNIKIGFVCFETEQQVNECIQQSPLIQIHGKQCYITPVTRRRMNELSKVNYEKPNSQQNASSSQQNASNSQQNASNSQQNASSSQQNASNSQQNASNSQQNASSSQQNASNSQQNASNSQQNASISQQNASNSQQNASISQQNASNSQQNASISQQNASNSQQNASISQQNASISQQNASISQQNASNSQQNASNSQQNASNSQQNASNSQQNASNSQQKTFSLLQLINIPEVRMVVNDILKFSRLPNFPLTYQLPVQFDVKPILKNEIIQKYPNNANLLQSLNDMSIVQANELFINQQLFNKWIDQHNNQSQLENVVHPNVLSEVICPVTEAKFTLVRNEIPQSITNLSQWAENILSRVNDGKNINISVDCEGYFLGLSRNSLSTIQIGEIFDDSYDVRTNDKPPNVGQKPGFIILAPFSKKVVQILSSILNNPNVMIYTFDFISDFATMMDIGIKINMNNVFDSQTANFTQSTNFFQIKTIKSLTWFVNQAKDMDPLGEKACETKNKNKSNYFFVTSYLFKDKKHPEREIMNKDLFEMGSADVYFTGLAALYCIKSNLHQNIIKCTKTKIKQFYKIMRKINSPLGPSITRQLFFFDAFSAKKYKKSIIMKNEKESDLLDLLIVFKNTYTVISAYKLLSMNNTICELDFDSAKTIYIETIKKLEEKKDLLKEMMKKYA